MPDLRGPFRNMRFVLEIEGIAMAGFATCRIPESTNDVIRYREGNDPPKVRKLAGLNRYGPLVLESGVTRDSIMLFEWYKLVEQGKLQAARRDVAIVLRDLEGGVAARWELKWAWPATYQAPRLDATGEDVAIEKLEIVCERLERGSGSTSDTAETEDGNTSNRGEGGGDDTLDDGEA